MLIYEKDGKLNMNFQSGNIPVEPTDVVISKEDNVAKMMLGSTEIKPVKNSQPSNLNESESSQEVGQ